MHTICVNIFPLSYSTPLKPLKGFWMDMLKVMVLDLKLEAISPADLLRARIFHSYKLLLNLLERDLPRIQKVTFLTSISLIGGFKDTVFSSKTIKQLFLSQDGYR